MLAEAEIEKKLPVWHVLSDVFLDTELQPEDYSRIAAALGNSGYSVSALKAIFEDEVAPAFVFNMLDVAGEWTSWNVHEVREIMLRSLRSDQKLPPMRWLARRIYGRYVRDEWQKISALL
jgi:hypothetical protein